MPGVKMESKGHSAVTARISKKPNETMVRIDWGYWLLRLHITSIYHRFASRVESLGSPLLTSATNKAVAGSRWRCSCVSPLLAIGLFFGIFVLPLKTYAGMVGGATWCQSLPKASPSRLVIYRGPTIELVHTVPRSQPVVVAVAPSRQRIVESGG